MSVLVYVAVVTIAAGAAAFMRRSQEAQIRCGLVGLAFAAIAALAIEPGDGVKIGGILVVGTQFAATFLFIASVAAFLIMFLSAVSAPVDDLAATTLAVLALVAVALSVADPATAVILLVAAGFLGVVLTLGPDPTPRDVVVVAREVRVLTVAGVAAMVAVAWIASPIGRNGPPGIIFGLAYLALVLAVALRFGAIPFHLWAARLADTVSELALPLLIAWLPCALAVVALGWIDTRVAPLEIPLDGERLIVAIVAVLTLTGGAFAATVQDDVRHVAGYSMLGDAGFILLGLTILEPTGWEATRTFILVYVIAKAALAAWAAALESAFGSRHLDDLAGWARRAPLLGAGFLAIVVATIGLPSMAMWDSRAMISGEAVGGVPGTAIFIAGLAPLVYYGRILGLGLAVPGALVRQGPLARLRRPEVGLDRWTTVREGWRLNRAPIAGGAVLALALLAVVGSAGGLGIPDAAGSLPPGSIDVEVIAPTP